MFVVGVDRLAASLILGHAKQASDSASFSLSNCIPQEFEFLLLYTVEMG